MKNGNMRKYLEMHHKSIYKDLQLNLCEQTAKGMAYLSDLKIIHRDLAARNCMLDHDLVVKISDFGLARDTFQEPYTMMSRDKRLPIRWMAPEINKTLKYSTATDVWAFGVVLWEEFMCGSWPYHDVPDAMVFAYIEQGNRLDKPDSMPDDLYLVMHSCMEKCPEYRPTFSELVTFLNNKISK